jgi:hypothetical protein
MVCNYALWVYRARGKSRLLNLSGDKDKVDREHWIFAGTYCTIVYVLSLRGPGGLLLDLKGCRKYFNSRFGSDGDPAKHVVVALLGAVKGKHNKRQQHLLPSVNSTNSGIQVRRWLRRTLAVTYSNNRVSGPGFCDEKGGMLPAHVMNEMLHQVLDEVWVHHPTLFLVDITPRTNIKEKYKVFRSFHRGSDS